MTIEVELMGGPHDGAHVTTTDERKTLVFLAYRGEADADGMPVLLETRYEINASTRRAVYTGTVNA